MKAVVAVAVAGVLLAVTVPVLAQTGLVEADSALARGDYALATTLYHQAAANAATSGQGKEGLGLVGMAVRDYGAGVYWFDRVVTDHPDSPLVGEALLHGARCCEALWDLTGARARAEGAVKQCSRTLSASSLSKGWEELVRYSAWEKWAADDWAGGIAAAQKVAADTAAVGVLGRPAVARSHILAGFGKARLGDTGGGRAEYEEAIGLGLSHLQQALAYFQAAITFEMEGAYLNAAWAFDFVMTEYRDSYLASRASERIEELVGSGKLAPDWRKGPRELPRPWPVKNGNQEGE